MNANVKLIQSALGLSIGMWMIACGGPSYDVINTERPGKPLPGTKKPAVKTLVTGKQVLGNQSGKIFRTKSDSTAVDTLFAFGQKWNEEEPVDWHAESYK
jgi:hypothetical protein